MRRPLVAGLALLAGCAAPEAREGATLRLSGAVTRILHLDGTPEDACRIVSERPPPPVPGETDRPPTPEIWILAVGAQSSPPLRPGFRLEVPLAPVPGWGRFVEAHLTLEDQRWQGRWEAGDAAAQVEAAPDRATGRFRLEGLERWDTPGEARLTVAGTWRCPAARG